MDRARAVSPRLCTSASTGSAARPTDTAPMPRIRTATGWRSPASRWRWPQIGGGILVQRADKAHRHRPISITPAAPINSGQCGERKVKRGAPRIRYRPARPAGEPDRLDGVANESAPQQRADAIGADRQHDPCQRGDGGHAVQQRVDVPLMGAQARGADAGHQQQCRDRRERHQQIACHGAHLRRQPATQPIQRIRPGQPVSSASAIPAASTQPCSSRMKSSRSARSARRRRTSTGISTTDSTPTMVTGSRSPWSW